MAELSIAPYFHPTTIVFVDDNDLFLQALDLRVPADTACLPFHNPAQAIARINRRLDLRSIPDRCFLPMPKSTFWPDTVIRFDAGLIAEEINHLQRFRRVSVVVADLGIPAMDGLALCARIDDPTTKKVLMTGASDQRRAVDAFNDGVIDRFVEKNRTNTLELVVEHIVELQQEYFLHQQRSIQESLSLTSAPMLEDPAVMTHFEALRRRHGFVEHYLIGEPPGFVCLTAKGTMHRILVLSDSEVAQQAEYARAHAAPTDVVQAIESRSRIGYFYDRSESQADEPHSWRDLLHAPTRVSGKKVWWMALAPISLMEIEPSGVDLSFGAYLDEIDAAI